MTPRKILVLQLARLGDIYQTRPVLRAMKRSWPGCEIHFLSRSRFAAAAIGSTVVDRHWALDTRDLLTPLVDEKPDLDGSLAKLEALGEELRNEGFDRIVNLSFSPFSSYLTKEATGLLSDVRGYTRFNDGYLAIPDDGSAYFYAQVGTDKANRLHVTELFAYVAGVELAEEDWEQEAKESGEAQASIASSLEVSEAGGNAIVVHLGASDLAKTLSWSKWLQVVKGLMEAHDGNVVLVGSAEERQIADQVAAISGSKQPINLVGRTNLAQLFEIIRQAKLVIGGDSAPVQIASLTNTPVLNLSFPIVSFWETGPRSAGSRILRMESEDSYASDQIVAEARAMLNGQPPVLPVIRVPGRTIPYLETRPQPRTFEWELLRAIYMGEMFPAAPSSTFMHAIVQLADVNQLALEQIETLQKNPQNTTAGQILNRVDEILEQIQRMVPETGPLIRWFHVERLRIGPMPVEALIEATRSVHQRLHDVLCVYTGGNPSDQTSVADSSNEGEVRS